MKITGRKKASWDMENQDPTYLLEAIRFLADRDHDHARELNGCGFSKIDTQTGHYLARLPILEGQHLPLARHLVKKYRRQLEDFTPGGVAPRTPPISQATPLLPLSPLPSKFEHAVGFFSKFRDRTLRQEQIRALEFIEASQRNVAIINAPTGVGKTLIGMISGMLFSPPAEGMIYLPHTKILQDQIVTDFPEAEILKGRNNYKCLRNTLLTADYCTNKPCVNKDNPNCDKCKYFDMEKNECDRVCKYVGRCPYKLQKEIVLKNRLRILNYSYFIHEVNYMGQFSGKPIVICDEADSLEKIILDFISTKISKNTINKFGLELPRFRTAKAGMKARENELKDWIEWARQILPIINRLISERENNKLLEAIKEKKSLEGLREKMNTFLKYVDETWIFEETAGGFEFKPTWLTPEMARDHFWKHASRFVLMSATFPPKAIIAKSLGLAEEEIDYLELTSPFPVENRKVIIRPVANLVYKNMDTEVGKTIKEVKHILQDHQNDKGIIHTVSYKLASQIMDIGNKRLISHDNKNTKDVLELFKRSPEPLVLVSPSQERGLDLAGDLGRFAIWCKAPYLSIADKQVAARLYGSGRIGKLWYQSDCVTSIIQGSGRVVRGMEDYGVTYIIDEQVLRILRENPGLFPEWFRKAIFIERN